jgi:hypothetical protein
VSGDCTALVQGRVCAAVARAACVGRFLLGDAVTVACVATIASADDDKLQRRAALAATAYTVVDATDGTVHVAVVTAVLQCLAGFVDDQRIDRRGEPSMDRRGEPSTKVTPLNSGMAAAEFAAALTSWLLSESDADTHASMPTFAEFLALRPSCGIASQRLRVCMWLLCVREKRGRWRQRRRRCCLAASTHSARTHCRCCGRPIG